MITNEEIEGFLYHLDYPFEQKGEGLWVLTDADEGIPEIILLHLAPILTIRLNVMPVPEDNQLELFRRLLGWNAREMVHGAYGVDDGMVVLTDALQSPNLDLNELMGSIESIVLAVHSHYPELSTFVHRGKDASGAPESDA